MPYSQNAEEGVINSLFGNRGRFLDIGAFDGKHFSNTLRLYERGWNGVLVEPSPKCFNALQKQYNNSGDRIILYNAALTKTLGEIDFYEANGDAVSTTEISHRDKWEKGSKSRFVKISVKTITFDKILDDCGTDFGFINIDTEGTNVEVLKLFPFNRCLPMVICVEYDYRDKEILEYVKKYGFRSVYQSDENLVLYRGS